LFAGRIPQRDAIFHPSANPAFRAEYAEKPPESRSREHRNIAAKGTVETGSNGDSQSLTGHHM